MPSYCRQSQRPTPITSATTISLFQLQLPSLNGSRTNRVCSNGTFAQTVRRSAAHLFSMCTNVGRARKAALRWFARLAVSQLRLLNGRPCICTFVARTSCLIITLGRAYEAHGVSVQKVCGPDEMCAGFFKRPLAAGCAYLGWLEAARPHIHSTNASFDFSWIAAQMVGIKYRKS